jgi:lysophospholipase L1-like esterase
VTQLLIEDSTCAWSILDVGVSGASIATTKDNIDTIIGAVQIPKQIAFINLGVNNTGSETESEIKTNYQYIIDAVHTKWPDCIIYLTKPWSRGWDAGATTLAGWIDDLVAANSGVCFVADNEAIWLKGADNGATMTIDGTHYSTTGETEKASQMMTVFGYKGQGCCI